MVAARIADPRICCPTTCAPDLRVSTVRRHVPVPTAHEEVAHMTSAASAPPPITFLVEPGSGSWPPGPVWLFAPVLDDPGGAVAGPGGTG